MSAPSRPVLPIGFPLLAAPDAAGRLVWPSLEASVRGAIRALLMTRKGELILRRDIGVGLADYLHRPNTAINRRELRDAVVETLTRHEPRIALSSVDVETEGERGETLGVAIRYRILRTGAADEVSLSMRLGG